MTPPESFTPADLFKPLSRRSPRITVDPVKSPRYNVEHNTVRRIAGRQKREKPDDDKGSQEPRRETHDAFLRADREIQPRRAAPEAAREIGGHVVAENKTEEIEDARGRIGKAGDPHDPREEEARIEEDEQGGRGERQHVAKRSRRPVRKPTLPRRMQMAVGIQIPSHPGARSPEISRYAPAGRLAARRGASTVEVWMPRARKRAAVSKAPSTDAATTTTLNPR